MYTFAPTSQARRSAQTVLWQITEALVRLVAPILTFTADEIWEHLPAVAGRPVSVHLALFPRPEEIFSEDPAPVIDVWKRLLYVRDNALQALELARQRGLIGKALEADILISADGDDLALLFKYEAALKEMINVSQVIVHERADNSIPPSDFVPQMQDGQFVTYMPGSLALVVRPASGSKCARCWNFMPEVSNYGVWENVCTRCQSALREMGIEPPQAAEPPAVAVQ